MQFYHIFVTTTELNIINHIEWNKSKEGLIWQVFVLHV
jgi:hypothetical protein